MATVMKRRGLTQEETSRRSRIMTLRTLKRIMDGENIPSLERAVALSSVLDTPIEDLFTFELQTRIVPAR